MSVTQLTLLTSLSMMGAGIIMLPAKFAEIGAISMLSWIVTALASGAVAYVFAQCGILSKRMGGLGGFAKYAFGEPGAFLVNYSYAISLVFGNIAISLAAVSYSLSWFHLPFSSVFACIGSVLLLWIASLLTLRSPYITGRITGIFVWALLLPLITLVIVGGFWFDPALYAAIGIHIKFRRLMRYRQAFQGPFGHFWVWNRPVPMPNRWKIQKKMCLRPLSAQHF